MKTIGIVSDIHGYLSQEAHDALRGSDYIICAGDSESPQVIMELECIAPTIAIRGNCDRLYLGPGINDMVLPTIEGIRFKVVHRPEDIGSIPDDVKIVINGHTHIPRYQEQYGITYINPGSPTRPRGNSDPGVGRLVVDNGKIISYERIDLPS